MKEETSLRRKNGFTLLELVISIALLSVVLAALYSTFFLSHKAVEGVDESLLKLHECRVISDTLSREAESAVYSEDTVFVVKDRDIYGKQASGFVFTSFSPLRPGLSRISYYVEEKNGLLTLYKKISSAYKPDGSDNGAELVENIEAFSVEVMNKGEWVKTWDASTTGNVPQELKFTLTVLIKGKPVTLYETVRPKTGTVL